MRLINKFMYCTFLLVQSNQLNAQSADTLVPIIPAKKNELTATVAYQSYTHFLGRSDNLGTTATVPVINYKFKNGIYLQAAAVFIENSSMPFQYTGTSFEAGYNFMENDSTFSGSVYGSYFLYKDNSVLVKSAIQYQAGLNTVFKSKIVNISPTIEARFGDKTDIGINLALSHLFIKRISGGKIKAIAFNPTITAYTGTQYFNESYAIKNSLPLLPLPQNSESNSSKIMLLAVETIVPVLLVTRKWSFFVIPAYVIPQNLKTISADETGENKIYFTAGCSFRF